jgi:DNA repair exonuclease SbcCD nuclease subunit
MKQLRFLHIGDMHIDHDPKFKAKIQPSLDQIVTYCKEVKINAVVIPGDLTHRKQSYSGSSGVPMLISFLKDLSRLVDFIFITKGNHDEPGSIALLHQIESNVYSYEYPVVLAIKEMPFSQVTDLLRLEDVSYEVVDNYEYIISLIPYPTKASLLIEDSIDNNNVEFIQKFEQIFEHIGDITEAYNCPKILGFHGNIVGSRLSSGQTLMSQDLMVAPSTLEKAKHDYYPLNHIHTEQDIKEWMGYAGGIANFNWGETEQKSFRQIEFLGREFTVDKIPFTSARPMVTVEAEFTPGMTSSDFIWDGKVDPALDKFANAEFRFRCKVKENERNLITDEKIEQLKKYFGDDVKIEFNITPVERESRSEQIMNCKDLLQEVLEYAKVIEHKVDNGVMTKVATLQEKGVESL